MGLINLIICLNRETMQNLALPIMARRKKETSPVDWRVYPTPTTDEKKILDCSLVQHGMLSRRLRHDNESLSSLRPWYITHVFTSLHDQITPVCKGFWMYYIDVYYRQGNWSSDGWKLLPNPPSVLVTCQSSCRTNTRHEERRDDTCRVSLK